MFIEIRGSTTISSIGNLRRT